MAQGAWGPRAGLRAGQDAAGQVARVWRAPRRTAEDVEDVRREVQIMHHLEGHANIVKIFGAYEDKHSVHLALPGSRACVIDAAAHALRLRRLRLRQTKRLHAGA